MSEMPSTRKSSDTNYDRALKGNRAENTPLRSKNIINAGWLACISLISSPATSFAAAGAAGHSGSISDLFWPAINFTLYVGGMFWLLRKIVTKGWSDRASNIEAQASKGERELAAANAILSAAKERQTKLPGEKAAIAKALASEAQAEVDKTLSDAKERAREIEHQAANRIVAEQQAAKNNTRRIIAERVIAATEKRIQAGISAEQDRRIRENTAKSMRDLKQG